MLNLANERRINERAELKKVDLTSEWNVENQFADLVTSILTLEHIENLNHIFLQANMKLKNDGLFFIRELHPFKQYLGSKAKYNTEMEL